MLATYNPYNRHNSSLGLLPAFSLNHIVGSLLDDIGCTTLVGTTTSPNETLHYDEDTRMHSIALELPGYKREDITVEVVDQDVVITAKSEKRGTVTRAFWFEDVDTEKIGAKLEDGVLTVTVPRMAEVPAKRVEIR